MPRESRAFRKMRPELEERYGGLVEQAGGYDPQEQVNRSAQAQFDLTRPQFERDLRSLRGSQVGMGRLQTGYGQEDEDYLVSQSQENLNRQIASRSLEGERLGLENRQDYGDLITGGLDRGRQEEEDERERKRGGWRGFLGSAAGTLAGSFLGPVGASVGNRLGSKLAESI